MFIGNRENVASQSRVSVPSAILVILLTHHCLLEDAVSRVHREILSTYASNGRRDLIEFNRRLHGENRGLCARCVLPRFLQKEKKGKENSRYVSCTYLHALLGLSTAKRTLARTYARTHARMHAREENGGYYRSGTDDIFPNCRIVSENKKKNTR